MAAQGTATAEAAAMQRATEKLTGPGGPYEVGPLQVRHGVQYPRGFLRVPATMSDFLTKQLHTHHDLECLVFDAERYTYAQIDAQSTALARALLSTFGVARGDRAAIAMRNYPEWCVSFIAYTRIGVIAVPLNSLWRNAEYAYGLRDSGARVLICDVERCQFAGDACASLGVKVVVARHNPGQIPAGAYSYAEVIASGQTGRRLPESADDPDDPINILYTSGSTGNPKGVVQTHRNIMQQMAMTMAGRDLMRAVEEELGTPPEQLQQDCIILAVPLFHVTGLHHVFLSALALGRRMVLMDRWSPIRALQLIDREKPNTWTGVPTQVQDMMMHPDFEKYDTSSLQAIGGGGGPTPTSQVGASAKKYPSARPMQGYGLTETNGAVTFITGEDYLTHPTSVGRGFPIVEFQVRHPESRAPLPPNEPGELWIKSPLNMLGYYNLPEKTAEVLDSEGWFASGDIARMDEEGYVHIVDRIKDIIIRGGENISTAEVEAAFHETEMVLECAAIGLPDERLGETVGIVVVPRQGSESVTAVELRQRVVGRLADFKLPAVENIFLSPEPLPRGATEKIQKREIRERIASRRGALPPPRSSKL